MEPVMVTVPDLAEQMHVRQGRLYELARRADDPLPLRTQDGMKRSSAILVSDWKEWWKRNSKVFKEVTHG